MKKLDLMKIAYKDPNLIKRVLLTKRKRDIIRFIKKSRVVVSIGIAYHFDISLPAACTALKVLYDAGYLNREELIQESGGIEYEYRSNI